MVNDFKNGLGELCIDILKSQWTPVWTLQLLCKAVAILLEEPNADDPLNCDAGNLIRNNDIIGFEHLARFYTHEYAM